jgi:hypothetical protein
MTFGAPEAGGLPRQATFWVLVSTFGLAASLTLVWLGMRAVMDIGGACADGGPYVSAQQCPDGVPLLMILGIFGLFGFGGLGFWAGARIGGPWIGLPMLAWPALFLSLGWNFLEYGVSPPEPFGDGPELGWLIPGVIFVLMGGTPLVVAWRARGIIGSDSSALPARFGMPSIRIRGVDGSRPPSGPASMDDPTADPDVGDLVGRLERLARLRRAGDITDAEYEAAKAAIIGSGVEGS